MLSSNALNLWISNTNIWKLLRVIAIDDNVNDNEDDEFVC